LQAVVEFSHEFFITQRLEFKQSEQSPTSLNLLACSALQLCRKFGEIILNLMLNNFFLVSRVEKFEFSFSVKTKKGFAKLHCDGLYRLTDTVGI